MENKENLKEYMLKEIEIIQDIIKRLDSHQFMIKGWAITLVVVTLLLKGNEYQVLIAFIPLLVFWFLDAHFLRIERMYRKMYEWIISNRLKTNEHVLDMDAYRFEAEVESTPQIMVSITLRWFYGSIAVLIIIYALILL